MRPLRILKVVTRVVRGGAQGTMLAMAAELRRRGHRVDCLYGPADRGEGTLASELNGACDASFRVDALVRDPDPLQDLAAFRALAARLAEGAYDVVHTYTSKAGFLGRLAAALARVPAVVHSPQGHVFATGARIPGVSGFPARRRAFLAMERLAGRWADALVALSAQEAVAQVVLGIAPATRFVVLPNPVADRFFAPAPAPAATGARAPFTVVCVGRLSAEKGQRFLLEAFARARGRLARAALWLVGDGPDRADLEALARAAGLSDAVRFWGIQEDVRPFLAGADLFVLPSSYEAQGIALLEAMAAGLPVVATAVGGVPAFIADGRNGRLVPFGDAERLAGILVDLAGDPPRRAALAVAGRRTAARYRVSAIAERLEGIYRGILARKTGGR